VPLSNRYVVQSFLDTDTAAKIVLIDGAADRAAPIPVAIEVSELPSLDFHPLDFYPLIL